VDGATQKREGGLEQVRIDQTLYLPCDGTGWYGGSGPFSRSGEFGGQIGKAARLGRLWGVRRRGSGVVVDMSHSQLRLDGSETRGIA